jgi:hypothetical protein
MLLVLKGWSEEVVTGDEDGDQGRQGHQKGHGHKIRLLVFPVNDAQERFAVVHRFLE